MGRLGGGWGGGVPAVKAFLQPSALQLFSAYSGCSEECNSLDAVSLTVSCRRRLEAPDPTLLLRSYFSENSCSEIGWYSSAPHLERRDPQSVHLEAITTGCKLNATRFLAWWGGWITVRPALDHGMAAQRCDLGTPLPRVLQMFVGPARPFFLVYEN